MKGNQIYEVDGIDLTNYRILFFSCQIYPGNDLRIFFVELMALLLIRISQSCDKELSPHCLALRNQYHYSKLN